MTLIGLSSAAGIKRFDFSSNFTGKYGRQRLNPLEAFPLKPKEIEPKVALYLY